MTATARDIHWMTLAMQLAKQGLYTTDPNPRVGCVIERDGQKLGAGFHAVAGELHAERRALEGLTPDETRGSSCYVTLEPCSHTGRTGPCADALIKAGVARVVIAMTDPNPLVAGKGVEKLKAAGIEVETGVLEVEARALNPGFYKRMTQGRPWVRVKLAASLDGRIAMASGESFWVTGQAAREDVQRLRARSSAIVTGMGTFTLDQPSLTVRPNDWTLSAYGSDRVRQPLRILLDSRGRADPQAGFFKKTGASLVVTANKEAADHLRRSGLDALPLGAVSQVDLNALLDELGQRECNEVLVEAGGTLAGAFLEANLVDELVVYQAPVLLGQKAKPMAALDIDTMANKYPLTLVDERRIGKDRRYTFSPSVSGMSN